jgi:hypothetical protein
MKQFSSFSQGMSPPAVASFLEILLSSMRDDDNDDDDDDDGELVPTKYLFHGDGDCVRGGARRLARANVVVANVDDDDVAGKNNDNEMRVKATTDIFRGVIRICLCCCRTMG